MAKHYKLGKKGEKIALFHLKQKGYQILEKNWRKDKKEIDIIAKKNNIIVFIEVKTRSTEYYGEASEAVNTKKQKNLIDAAEEYIEQKNLDMEIRFDIISVYILGNKTKLFHIEDAFNDTLL